MHRMIESMAAAAALAALAACGGCTTAAKELTGGLRGGLGSYVELKPVAPLKSTRPLGGYTRFKMERFKDDFAGMTPPQILNDLPAKFYEELDKAEIPNRPGGKTLLIRGTVLHYEDAGMMDLMLGPVEEVVARVELVDEQSGALVGRANCIGRTKARLPAGVKTKVEGLARAIKAWIEARYPKPAE
jgi:hypothetical protein